VKANFRRELSPACGQLWREKTEGDPRRCRFRDEKLNKDLAARVKKLLKVQLPFRAWCTDRKKSTLA
jgi:hypothetical protein